MAGPSPDSSVPGVISHYRLRKALGGGGMGEVYKATDRRDRSTVAVKLLYPHLAREEAFRERFEREAHVGALLRSPYTVHLLDYGFSNGRYFLVMEYVEGMSLREATQGGPMEVKRALRIAAQVARALEEAEARGVVHRDIKPENILLGSGDSVKVADFGIARQMGSSTLTTPGAFVGTLAYAAPELAMGKADHRSDIYSLGGTLYHVLTGRPPYRGDALEMLRHHADTPLPLEPLSGLPETAVEIIKRCLEKDPNNRYQSASALAGALEHAAAAAPTPEAAAPTVVEEKTAAGPAASPEELLAATQVAEKPAAEAKPMPVTLELGPARAGFPFGGRLGSTTYQLTVRNGGGEPAQVRLEAGDQAGRCSFSMASNVSVPANGTKTFSLRVRPRARRWRGGRETYPFTVSALQGDGAPPATVSGQFDDVPYGWLPYGGLFGVGAVGAVVAAVLLLGGGGSETAGAVTDEELSRMVLPQADLGPEYSAFTLDPNKSGFQRNEGRVASSCDTEREAADIQRLGRVNGYSASYQSAQQVAAGSGTFLVSNGVEQYKDRTGAGQGLEQFMADPAKGMGTPECQTLTTLKRDEFTPSTIGDEARGVEVRVSQAKDGGQKVEYTLTIVEFVRGSLVGRVMIGHFDSPDYRGASADLARKLDGRVQGVLSEKPSASASPPPSGSGSPAPSGSGSPSPTGTGQATPGPTGAPSTGGAKPTSTPGQQPPGAQAPAINSLGCSPITVQTGQTVSCNPAVSGTVTSWSWSASGGSPSSGSGGTFSTSFGAPATSTISLTVCNGSACNGGSQTIGVVSAPPPPSAPVINSLGCGPITVQIGEAVSCNPSVSGTVTSWSWSAPAGSPSSGNGGSFATSFGSPGNQAISLTACNGGACASGTQGIAVSAPVGTYQVFIDSAAVTPGAFVTVTLYIDAPAAGVGSYDIDIGYDPSVISAVSCTSFDINGFCDAFFTADTANFTGFMGLSGTLFIGSVTFQAGFSTGVSPLIISLFTLDDVVGNDVSATADVFDGDITVQ